MGSGASRENALSELEAELKKEVLDAHVLRSLDTQNVLDTVVDAEGKIPRWQVLKKWMPHPGVGKTKNCWQAEYTERKPDYDYDLCLSANYDDWVRGCYTEGSASYNEWSDPEKKTHVLMMSKSMFGSWPRGEGPGELLREPILDEVPVDERGIKKEWMAAVWDKWIGKEMYWYPLTRMFVSNFVKPITKPFQCDLYDLVPLNYRAKPECFLSHSWDTPIHCIFKACPEDNRGAQSYWLDLFCINQHCYGDDIGKIGKIVENIKNTTVVLRGEGVPEYNLRCMYRSWCIYEVVHTPNDCLNFFVTAQNGDHAAYGAAIRVVDVRNASALMSADKEDIDKRVVERFGSFEAANKLVRKLMLKGYLDFFSQGHGFGEPGTEDAMDKGRRYALQFYGE